MTFGGLEGLGASYSLAPTTATGHSFSVLPFMAKCKSGSGISITGGGIDILGTK
jgi:hypothetical protein